MKNEGFSLMSNDFDSITYKMDTNDMTDPIKSPKILEVIHGKIKQILADNSKSFEALSVRIDNDKDKVILHEKNPLLILEGEGILLWNILKKFKNEQNLQQTSTGLYDNVLFISEISDIKKTDIASMEIQIQGMPSDIDVNNIQISQNECLKNSYCVAKENSDTKIIEGFIILIDQEKQSTAKAHAWNERNGIYFDVTAEEVWKKMPINKNIEAKYFALFSHNYLDFKKQGVVKLEFESLTNEYVESYVEYIKNKSSK